jgi:uncharacterized protein (DUF427 family)
MEPVRIEPGPGQESVWDYPRPPRLEECSKHIQVLFNGVTLVDSKESIRILETSHPPVYYIPRKDIRMEYLLEATGSSFCEWKGRARYFTVAVDRRRVERAAWSYPTPRGNYLSIKDFLAFFPSSMDRCLVDGERVKPQAGGFYGGWITGDLVGPFKGEPGSEFW